MKVAKGVADRYQARGAAGNAMVIFHAHAQAARPCSRRPPAVSRRRIHASALIGRRLAGVPCRAEPQALRTDHDLARPRPQRLPRRHHADGTVALGRTNPLVSHPFGRADTAGGRAGNDYTHDGATRISGAAVAYVRALAQPVRDRGWLIAQPCPLTWYLVGAEQTGRWWQSACRLYGLSGMPPPHMSKVEWRAPCKRSMKEFPDVKW